MTRDEQAGVCRKMPQVGRGRSAAAKPAGIDKFRDQDSYTMTQPLKAPFPYPGGKSEIAPAVWARFGQVANYVEPFAGSSAMLLARPGGASGTETMNDLDGLLVNAYRAIQYAPDETAAWCDWPVSEVDLTARHLWLKAQRDDLTARLFADPLYCDAQAAGWWLWGIASWIGDGWGVADGPWTSVEGRLVDRRQAGGIQRRLQAVGAVTNANGKNKENDRGVMRREYRAGVPRKMPQVGRSDTSPAKPAGVEKFDTPSALTAYFAALADRLRRVRFLCGDWRRVVKPSIAVNHGLTAVYLDPPYPAAEHAMAYHGADDCWQQVAQWALDHGDDPRLRIALSGYYDEQVDALFPATWARERWQARGGYANQADKRGRRNAAREIVYYSPHCVDPAEQARSALAQPLVVRESDYTGTLFEV